MGRAWRDRTVALTRAWALTGGAAGPVPHGCRRGRPTLRDTSGGEPALQPSSASAVCLRLMATAVVAASSCSAAAQELRNWFDDPFFQLTAAVAACPEPAGPRSTEAERLAQSMIEEAKGRANDEGAKIVAAARAEAEQEATKAREALREQVAALAVKGAESILKRELNPGVHAELLNQLKAEL